MITIGPLNPLFNTAKYKRRSAPHAAHPGSEVNQDAPAVVSTQERRRKDRRKQATKPLIEMRCGRDRRENAGKRSVDIEV